MLAEPIAVVSELAAVFEELGINYLVGGSFASSIYGIPRATQDVDLVADLKLSHAEPLTRLLGGRFYVDLEMVKDAIEQRRTFNVIHLESLYKADIFVMASDTWANEEMARARSEEVQVEAGSVRLRFASPEDTLLHKLVWYRLGGEVSERQWSDVLGILRVQGDRLDTRYLDHWSERRDVADLLARARSGVK